MVALKLHSNMAPSAASRWLLCGGSVAFTKDMPDVESEYAKDGTRAHELAASQLNALTVRYDTEEQKEFIQVYLDYVRRESEGKILRVEQRISLTPITGEENAFGTADAVIIDEDEIHICDLKFGQGVAVSAKNNKQLLTYLAAARVAYSELGPFRKFKVSIVQPKLDSISEWYPSETELNEFVFDVKTVAPSVLDGTAPRVPGEEQCRFCKGKATCPELQAQVKKLVSGGFENLDKVPEANLSESMSMTGMVEDWIKAVRAEVERRLISGVKVLGWKLVQGRLGARQWTDQDKVAEVMKKAGLGLEQMYKMTLITPTQAEKNIGKKNEALWNAVQEFVAQKEGAPSVAPSTDPRPEIGSAADAFDNVGDAA